MAGLSELTEEQKNAIIRAIKSINGKEYTRPEGKSADEIIAVLQSGGHESMEFDPESKEIDKIRASVFLNIYNEESVERGKETGLSDEQLLEAVEEAEIGFNLNGIEALIDPIIGSDKMQYGHDAGQIKNPYSEEGRNAIRLDVAEGFATKYLTNDADLPSATAGQILPTVLELARSDLNR